MRHCSPSIPWGLIIKSEDVHLGIVCFDTAIQTLQAAGAASLEQELGQNLLDILQMYFREFLLLRADQPHGYAAFGKYMIIKAAEVLGICSELAVTTVAPAEVQ